MKKLRLDNMTFFDMAIKKNHWLWFHCLAGALFSLAWLTGIWFFNVVSPQEAVRNVFFIAFGWELLEWITKQFGSKWRNLEEYRKRFFVDSLFDIIGALLCAFGISLFF